MVGSSRPAGRGGLSGARLRRRRRLSEAAPDQVHQLLRLHRLVQVQMAALGDLAQCVGRDIAGEDDGWDLVTERLSQAGDDLEAVQTLRQIVVGDDEVRVYRPSRRQLQRLSSILGGRRAVALAFEQEREHLAHRRVVLDDQDCAALMCDFPLPPARRVEAAMAAHLVARSGTSTAKTEPLPGRDRTSTAWPSRSARRSTMARPRPRPLLRSRAGLSS